MGQKYEGFRFLEEWDKLPLKIRVPSLLMGSSFESDCRISKVMGFTKTYDHEVRPSQ